MKKLITLSSLILLLLSCTRKVTRPVQSAPDLNPSVTEVITGGPDTLAIEEPPTEAPPYLVAVLEKTTCYGKCPVFEVRLFSNGHLTYLGKKEVAMLGRYEAWTDLTLLEKVKAAAYQVHYFQLAEVYPTNQRQIEDIPLTITYLNFDDREKTIMNNYGSPKALRDFEDLLEGLLLKVNWKRIGRAK